MVLPLNIETSKRQKTSLFRLGHANMTDYSAIETQANFDSFQDAVSRAKQTGGERPTEANDVSERTTSASERTTSANSWVFSSISRKLKPVTSNEYLSILMAMFCHEIRFSGDILVPLNSVLSIF